MTGNKNIEIEGFEEMIQDIGRLTNLQDRHYWPVHDAMSEAVQQIETEAKDNLERNDSIAFGHLRDSIGSQVEITEDAIIGRVGSNLGRSRDGRLVGYAQPVEFGSKAHTPPLQPLIEWVRVVLEIIPDWHPFYCFTIGPIGRSAPCGEWDHSPGRALAQSR